MNQKGIDMEENFIPDDYTLELYQKDGTWIKQIMKTDNYAEIELYERENPCEDGYYYSTWCIQCDNETGEEMASFPWY